MSREPARKVTALYYSSVTGLYLVTLLLAWVLFRPFGSTAPALAASPNPSLGTRPLVLPLRTLVTGTPSRLVIPSIGKDLEIEPGRYDAASQTWSISASNAHYALPSMTANNVRGQTLIYGHYNLDVFYQLTRLQPGQTAELHTNNGHIFSYEYREVRRYDPSDVSVFQSDGPPILALQTCSGSFNEYRDIYYLFLVKVDGINV